MGEIMIAVLTILGTICAYIIAKWLYKRIYTPLLLPVAVATFMIVMVLLLFNISYETYLIGGNWINRFLGPAVVALAYPLYQNRDVLKEMAIPILVGTFIGAVVGVVSGVWMTKLVQFEPELIYSITPKSVTTPVAMEISEALGGISTLAAVFVMIAGIAGAMFGTYAFKLFGLKETIGRGVGYGSASHAIGTAKALENGQQEGSISTIAMILSAIFVSIITPLLMPLLM